MPGWLSSWLSLRATPVRVFLFTIAAIAVASSYYVAWRAPAAATFHDDGVYMVTAKALAEGKGYRIISLPQEIVQTKYPVLFPFLLSQFWKLNPSFPANVPWLKLLPLACGILWLWLSFLLIRDQGATVSEAAGVVLLAAASVWTVYVSTALLSETLFSLLTTASLLIIYRSDRSPSPALHIVAAAICAALAFHTRTIGVALIASISLVLALRKRWSHSVLFASIAGALCAPWIIWLRLNSPPATDAYYSSANYSGWNILFNFSFPQKAVILLQNTVMSLLAPAMLAGFPMKGWPLLIAAALGVLLLIGITRCKSAYLQLFIAAYVAIVLCWAWPPTRLLLPLLPLLYWAGWQWLSSYRRSAAFVAIAVTAASAFTLLDSSQRTLRLGDAIPTIRDNDSWYQLTGLLQKVKDSTSPNDVLAGNLDPLYYLYTGRKAVRGFQVEPYQLIYQQEGDALGNRQDILNSLVRQGARYWIQTPNSPFLEARYLLDLQRELFANSGFFRVAFAPHPTHVVYVLGHPESDKLASGHKTEAIAPEPISRVLR